jgi:hypothetical protein
MSVAAVARRAADPAPKIASEGRRRPSSRRQMPQDPKHLIDVRFSLMT